MCSSTPSSKNLAEHSDFDIRYSTEADALPLREWLKVRGMLHWFPPETDEELDNFARIWLGFSRWQEGALMTLLLVGCWVFVFGAISRRFERQSDVIGAWATRPDAAGAVPDDPRLDPEAAALFALALQQVARLNGIPERRRNWRHGRIADRVAYLRTLAADNPSREPIDRLVRRIKIALWLAAATGVALLALQTLLEKG